MISDVWDAIKTFIKRQFCKHDYKSKIRPCGFQQFEIKECSRSLIYAPDGAIILPARRKSATAAEATRVIKA